MIASAQLRRRLESLLISRLLRVGELLGGRLTKGLAAKGLTPAEFRLVGVLLSAPAGLRQRVLAERLGVRPPTVSAALNKLETAGVIERVEDPDDPRAWRVRLCAAAPLLPGVNLLEALEDEATSGLSKTDRKRLAELLERISTRLESP